MHLQVSRRDGCLPRSDPHLWDLTLLFSQLISFLMSALALSTTPYGCLRIHYLLTIIVSFLYSICMCFITSMIFTGWWRVSIWVSICFTTCGWRLSWGPVGFPKVVMRCFQILAHTLHLPCSSIASLAKFYSQHFQLPCAAPHWWLSLFVYRQ